MRKFAITLGALIVIAGLLGLAYPFVGNFINEQQHAHVVRTYQREIEAIPDTRMDDMLREAEEYNQMISGRGNITVLNDEEMEAYNAVLDMSVTGIIGYLDIPKISVRLPIYHGVEEKVLQAGIGHLPGSSLPVGGINTHTILSGHSGLPNSKIFTDLDLLKIGDTFTITVLNRTIAYEVDDISVKLPEDVKPTIEEGADCCTLVTCTPIGANTHRLLVHASRIPYVAPAESDSSTPTSNSNDTLSVFQRIHWPSPIVCVGIGILLLAIVVMTTLIIVTLVKNRRERRNHHGD